MNNPIFVALHPQQLDYIIQKLNLCPHGEVRGLIDQLFYQANDTALQEKCNGTDDATPTDGGSQPG